VLAKLVKIVPLSTPILGYYTVELGGVEISKISEFEKFDEQVIKFVHPQHQYEINWLFTVIEKMGLSGAKPYYFKNEGEFEYIPKIPTEVVLAADSEDYGLRLYCIYLSSRIVILLNGGIKTRLNPLDCLNVSVHFKRCKQLALKIKKGIQDGYIVLDNTNLIIDESFYIDI